MAFPLQNSRTIMMANSLAQATGATFTSQVIDTIGFDEAKFVFFANGGAGTALSPTIVLQEGSSTDASNFTSFTNYVANTSSSGFATSVTAATSTVSTSAHAIFNVDLRGRQRYFRALITGNNVGTGVTANIHGFATLSLSNVGLNNTAQANVTSCVVVNPS